MPKYKSKSKVKRGQALQNYWQLRNQRKFHSENLGKDPSTESNALHSSTTIAKTHVPFGVAVDEEIPLPDITQQQDNILPELIIEKDQPETGKRNISGRRIVDIKYFFSKLQEISNHSPYNCGVQSLKIVGEKRVGLSSKFTLECLMCKGKFLLSNIPAVVAGAVSVGIGYSQLDELLSAIDLPMMTEPLYQKQHEFVSNAWEKALGQSMQEAAEEEKRIALEKGRVTTGGIPIIDVIADGCWKCFHSIVAKLVGGKRVNYSLRSGYQARCSASAVTFNTKRKPTTILYKTIVGKSPKGRMSTFDNKYRKLRGLKKRANYKKPQKTCDAITQNKDYGEQSSKPDMGEDVLNLMKETFLSNLKKSKEERTWIERQTILQSESSEWLELRRSLLTASNFGKVIKMRPDTSCANIVKQLLYKINIDAVPLQHGREYEKKALQQLSMQEAVDIRPCGLYIDNEIPYLGATPDDPRHTRNMEIRNPIYVIESIKKRREKKLKKKIQSIIPIAEQEENTTLSLYQESTRSSTPVIPEAEQPTYSRYFDYNEF
ncbi:unnamed protein product [Parnassius apollo]|uniref:(apollo) hypothetical protein n=1 Tax=Parnassius apollo TaxID=110799 RepID=A0A8S3VYA3_PARAO|nr:unnamed protein product [Parnassius apollo]